MFAGRTITLLLASLVLGSVLFAMRALEVQHARQLLGAQLRLDAQSWADRSSEEFKVVSVGRGGRILLRGTHPDGSAFLTTTTFSRRGDRWHPDDADYLEHWAKRRGLQAGPARRMRPNRGLQVGQPR